MPFKNISLSGGLVTSRDPSLLSEGELSRADDAYYKPNDPAIHKINGRLAVNPTAETSAIVGARYIELDTDIQPVFVIHIANAYRVASAGEKLSFSDLVTALNGKSSLDSAYYKVAHFLFNGVDRNYTITAKDTAGNTVNPPDSTSTFAHGMKANDAAPTATTTTAGKVTLSSGSTIIYWIEERYKQGSTIVKRSSATSDETVTVTGAISSKAPQITHTIVNSDATHAALYATATDGSFPTGAEIQEVAVSGTTVTIGDNREGSNPALPTGSTYQLWTGSLFGVTSSTARNGPPPISTTGDVFQESLCVNDVSDRDIIRFSWPTDPHSFPVNNLIRFPTKEGDVVTFIRQMSGVLMVGLRDSLWRVNHLPKTIDSTFDATVVAEKIDGAFGVVGAYAGTTFSFGQGLRLAYVSVAGIMVASLGSWDIISDDIAFEDLVEFSRLDKSILVDNPEKFRLEFYYTPKGETDNSKALYLHYHPSHSKGGGSNFRAKVSGPINARSDASMLATISGRRRMFTSSNGKLWQEDKGQSDNSGAGGIKFNVRTGDLFFNQIGGEARLKSLWVHHQAHPNRTATARVVMRNEGDNDVDVIAEVDLSRREHTQAALTAQAESMQIGVENSDLQGPVSIDYLTLELDSLGASQEG